MLNDSFSRWAWPLLLVLLACEKPTASTTPSSSLAALPASVTSANPIPAPQKHGGFELVFSIYTAADEKTVGQTAASLVAGLQAAGWRVRHEITTSSAFPLPDEDYVQSLVGPDGLAAVKLKTRVLVFGARANGDSYVPLFPKAQAAILAASTTLDGHLWDQGSWSLRTPPELKTQHMAWESGFPTVFAHITVQTSRDPAGDRFVTVGLAKFGLPELLIEGAPPGDREQMSALINLVAQLLVERRSVPHAALEIVIDHLQNQVAKTRFHSMLAEGATGRMTIGLSEAVPGPHDPNARILRISLPGSGAADAGVQAAAAMEKLFGAHPQLVESIDSVSDEWKAASKLAIADLMKRKPELQKGLRQLQTLQVKVGFPIPGGDREWMWVDVLSWEGSTLKGRLANEPTRISTMKIGQDLTVDEADVADFLFWDQSTGEATGNYTGRTYQ